MRDCNRFTQFDPMYETLDELPEFDIDQIDRYVYIPNEDRFYVGTRYGWLPLGIEFPIHSNHIRLKLVDETSAVKAEEIPCWSDDYISNVQITVYDFEKDIWSAKRVEQADNSFIKNYHLDVYGFNKVSSNTLTHSSLIDNNAEISKSTTNTLNAIVNKSDSTFKLTDDTVSGLYLGDPCFTIGDSLILDEKFLSILAADDIGQTFFDSTSNTQFVVDNLGFRIENYDFISITGTPSSYKTDTHYVRSNGHNWATFNTATADEIFAPLNGCFDDCECEDPKAATTSLQQSLCQLFKYKHECTNYIQFEHLANSDEDLSMLMPPVEPSDVIPRIIYDVRTDEVWVWNCGEWIIDECKSVCKLETNRMYFNTVTRKLFYLACDCSVYCILCLPFTGNICE